MSLNAALPHEASASGPVERLLQVLKSPRDPKVIVLRYGIASEGLLFSRDGGRSFRTLCTTAIAKRVDRISIASAPYKPPALMDGKGRLLVNTFDAMWSDDGTGCGWTQQTGLDGKWITSIQLEPESLEVLAVANVSSGDNDDLVARSELLRRGDDGAWSVVGTLKEPAAQTRTYGGELLAASTDTGTRLYATIVSSTGPIDAPQVTSVVRSDDGGKTWTELPLPAELQDIALLAVDPKEPNRVLATVARDGAPDPLLLSDDGGKSFRDYGTAQEASGVTFAPDGRVFVADAGDASQSSVPGGVLTAARLGEPLTLVPVPNLAESSDTDCIDYDASTQKLRVCKLHRFGELDWKTGAFTELVQLETVAGLLECPGRDIKAECAAQLNSGPSWCCTGHYPFTPFCGEWDITSARGRRVSCGMSGRAADIAAGRGPSVSDAGAPAPSGTPLMSVVGDGDHAARAPTTGVNDGARVQSGCAVGDASTGPGVAGYGLLGLFTLSLARAWRRGSQKRGRSSATPS